MIKALKDLSISRKLKNLVAMTLKDSTSALRANGMLSAKIITKEVLKQRDPLSTILFNLVLKKSLEIAT